MLADPRATADFTPYWPRSYQRPACEAASIDSETGLPRTKHILLEMHRGSGKDITTVGAVAIPAMGARPGNYVHIFPFFAQGKRALWQERWFEEIWPPHWHPRFMETEMYVELTIPSEMVHPKFRTGKQAQRARYFVGGADDERTVDKYRGMDPKGVVLSEAAYMDEAVRDILRPRLLANGGWEVLNSTPNGNNWFPKLRRRVLEDRDWFTQVLTVDHTRKDAPGEDGSPVITAEQIEAERRAGMREEIIQREYYCSEEGFAVGTIYGDLIQRARAEGRVKTVPYDSGKPVGVWMDIGRSDPLAIGFYQVDGSAIRIIDYHAERGSDTDQCIAYLLGKPYRYGRITLPHDARASDFNAPDSIEWKMRRRMRCPVDVNEKVGAKQIGIDRVRSLFSRLVFDEAACSRPPCPTLPSLLDSLGNYRYSWSDERQDNSGPPIHDQYCHGADAVRTGAEGWKEGMNEAEGRVNPTMALTDFRVFGERERERERVVVEQEFSLFAGVR